jgi:hypothetical protein
MMGYWVERYPSEGDYLGPNAVEWDTLDEAREDAGGRVGRTLPDEPEWFPDADTAIDPDIPAGSVPLGAWHESDLELCGGVVIWEAP